MGELSFLGGGNFAVPMSHDPSFPPRDVERIWVGKDKHYRSGTSELYDRTRAMQHLQRDEYPQKSESVLDRAIWFYGEHGIKIPGLIPKWPIRPEQQRPWLSDKHDAALLEMEEAMALLDGSDDPQALCAKLHWLCDELEARVDAEGALLNRAHELLDLVRRGHPRELGAMAAMFVGAFRLLDVVSDGKMDGVVLWCHILGHHIQFYF